MTLRLSSPSIVRVRATGYEPSEEDDVTWKLTLIDRLLRSEKALRPVFGTLRASSPAGWAEIEVSAMGQGSRNSSPEALKRDLIDSGTAETLYDFARPHLQVLLAQIGSAQSTPIKAPEAELRFIEREEFERILKDSDNE